MQEESGQAGSVVKKAKRCTCVSEIKHLEDTMKTLFRSGIKEQSYLQLDAEEESANRCYRPQMEPTLESTSTIYELPKTSPFKLPRS